MKKLLLASTALVLSAGLAHAQAVRITGEGRMGIQYDSTAPFGGSRVRQENRLTLNFNVSVEADHGLTFGAWSRARMQVAGQGTAQQGVFSGSRVWVEASGFRLTFGNQDGALRSALTGPGTGYTGGARVGYEGGILAGDTTGLLGVSQGQDNLGYNPNTGVATTTAPRSSISYTMGTTRVILSHDRGGATEVGVRGSFDAFTVAAAYSNGAANPNSYAVMGVYNGGNWTVGALVSRIQGFTGYSLQGSVALGGGTLYGYVGQTVTSTGGVATGTARAYGLNYGYSLGGGATVSVGAERVGTRTAASVGVAFNF